MSIYKNRSEQFNEVYLEIKKKHRSLGILRVLVFLGMFYSFYLFMRQENYSILLLTVVLLIFFVVLLRLHVSMGWKLEYQKGLRDVNRAEHDFLTNDSRTFGTGKEFEIPNHPYSFDLDLFGERSLFQYLNRTESYNGGSRLANLLNRQLKPSQIMENQEAIKELSEKLSWRHEVLVYSRMSRIDSTAFNYLKKWSAAERQSLPKFSLYAAYVIPSLLLLSIVMYFVNDHLVWGYLVSMFFSLNLVLSILKMKQIQQELSGADKIHETIESYASIFKKIEEESFQSEKMLKLVEVLKNSDFQSAKEFKTLSRYFEKLNTIANIFVNVVFNGFWQFHVHALRELLIWKGKNATYVMQAVEVVSEIEALNSIANFAYNNKTYMFPKYSDDGEMYFKDLGHPLIKSTKRVCNDIDFRDQRFVILTGSNMSGKSTFLRTIGINLVLANIGAPVCASEAVFKSLPLFVSMRLTDSLEDSESYFYAEVKRLKEIVEQVAIQPCFVLLDEILRGTNSDDKQSGTIGVIHKLIKKETYGLIATHDLEVCEVANEYPSIVVNKCFEVAFLGDELVFDYKIQDGICKNKNATFIMKKMKIID